MNPLICLWQLDIRQDVFFQQKRIPSSCLVAVELCRYSGSLLRPALPLSLLSLCSLSTQRVGNVAAVPHLPTVIDLCLEFLSNLLKATPRGYNVLFILAQIHIRKRFRENKQRNTVNAVQQLHCCQQITARVYTVV